MNYPRLQDQINRKFLDWRKEFGKNLVGVHIGYKRRDGNFIQRYNIVFHVSKKFSNPTKPFPKTIAVKIDGENKKEIPTDVIETGTLKLQSYLG